jgi:NAD-dependent SIR2 family protein deacetylase
LPKKPPEKIAIFLGAGASAAEGAPLQRDLFRKYFELIQTRFPKPAYEKDLKLLFRELFDIDVKERNLKSITFPTFEEVLGIVDLADIKKESFRHFPNLTLTADGSRIRALRFYLLLLLADIIHNSLKRKAVLHRALVNNLSEMRKIGNVTFLTTNYDILCDNALLDLWPGKLVEYGVDFVNYRDETFQRPDETAIPLFKLHGSLNWMHCPTCNNLRLTRKRKATYDLISNPQHAICPICDTTYSPVIVPPTFYKDLSKVFLSDVWYRAEIALLEVNHIIFCGYSFPDADIHIKYLLKRVQKNRHPNLPLKFTIINNHDRKEPAEKIEEKNRFKRFLGDRINYTDLTFREFAHNPTIVVK